MAIPARRSTPRVARVASAAILVLLCRIASAQADSSFELDPVTVTASRIKELSSASPPAISVVSAADIAARGATTIAEALKLVPGLRLSDKGSEGSQVSVSIRGSTTNQVLVLVDGARVNDALTGLVDISEIPLDSVERIEVSRGGGSSLYGGDAVGGIVNIITRRKGFPLSLSFENGSYLPSARISGFGSGKVPEAPSAASLIDTQKASVSWGPRLGDAVLRLALSSTRAGNAYTFIDPNGDERELQNASLLGGDASAGITIPLGVGSFSADVSGYYAHKGVPGSESSPTLGASEEDTDASLVARYTTERFLSDIFSLEASARLTYSGLDFTDAEHPSSEGHHRILTGATEVTQRAFLSDSLTLVYGGALSYAAASSDTVGSPERLSGGAYVETACDFGRLSLRPSLRYDYYSDSSSNDYLAPIGAALGATYRISDTDILKLNLARAYRVPTFEDLYWPTQDGAEGNPSLKPETSYEANLGFESLSGDLRYSSTVFARYSQDVILWQPGEDGIWRPSNFGAALYPGVELELKARLEGGYSASVSYSYLYSYVLSGGFSLSDDKRLPMTPVHNLEGTLSHDAERFSWSTTFEYASLRYIKTANVAYLGTYFVLDAFLRWKAAKGLSFYAGIDNLFDEQYEIVDGYPMPGTKIRVGAELAF